MTEPADLGKAHLRVVRPSDDLAANVKFYCDGLGFEVLYEFRDHDGFDAVMLGRKEAAYHLAFVHKVGHKAGRAPSKDNLLVFYLPDAADWERAVARPMGPALGLAVFAQNAKAAAQATRFSRPRAE